MYRSYFLSKDAQKNSEYKRYTKSKNKKEYYTMQFSKYQDNLKQTWKLIGSLVKRKTQGQISLSRIIHNNMTFTNQKDIAELFNRFFVNIGPTLAKKIKTDHTDPTQYIKSTPANSFFLVPVTQAGLTDNKASLHVPNKLIKLANGPLESMPFTRIWGRFCSF